MKQRILVSGVGSQYGGTEIVVSRLIGMLSREFEFDSISHANFKQPEYTMNDNQVIVVPRRRENIFSYEIEMKKIYEDAGDKYQALWHNSNSFSNIDSLKLAAKNNIPVRICHFHNTEVIGNEFNKVLHKMHRYQAGKLATYRLAASREAGQFAFGDMPFDVFPDAFDVDEFSFSLDARGEVRREFNLLENHVIGTVGRLAEQKNQLFLVELMPEILSVRPDTKLIIVGEGLLKEKILKRASQLGVAERVILTGVRTDVKKILCACDVFAFPSIFEGLGIAAIEAQANGLPCVLSTNVPDYAVVSDSAMQLSLQDRKHWIKALAQLERASFRANPTLLCRFDINSAAQRLAAYFNGDALK